LAGVYRIDPDEAERKCDRLLGRHREQALKSIEYLEQAKAFELAALALADVADPVVKNNLITFIATKKQFSRSVFAAAARELEQANADSSKFDDGEYRAGVENTKKILTDAIANWLDIPKPQAASGASLSATDYLGFVKAAKAKSRRMTNDSPF
jgi:hypothetical protein